VKIFIVTITRTAYLTATSSDFLQFDGGVKIN